MEDYISKPSYIRDVKTVYQNAIPFIMSAEESIDIDNKKDLYYSEFLISKINSNLVDYSK